MIAPPLCLRACDLEPGAFPIRPRLAASPGHPPRCPNRLNTERVLLHASEEVHDAHAHRG